MSALSTDWLAETLLASTLLMVVVLLLRHPTARVFGPRVSYLLWVLPALRLILPPLPQPHFAELPVGVGLAVVDQISLPMAAAQAPMAALAATPIDWTAALLAVWLAGAAAHFLWHLVAYHRFLVATGATASPLYSVFGVTVHAAEVTGPAATGILHRRVLLPHDFSARFETREQHLALAHELAHHKRGDLVANWIALLALSVQWFNPVAHIAYRAFRADQELACDATVLATSSTDTLHAYASAIVKATWDRGIVAACPLNHAGQLKRRLKMMRLEKQTLARTASGLAMTLAVMGGCLVATASASVTAPVVSQAIQTLTTQALTSNAQALSAAPSPSGPSEVRTEITRTEASLAEPVAAVAEPTLNLSAHSEAAPVIEVAAAAPPGPIRTLGYRTAGPSPRQFAAPASKALFLSLMDGRGPDGSPLQVQNIMLFGLSSEEVKTLTEITRRAGNSRDAAEVMSRLGPEIFEGAAAGPNSLVVDVSWSPRITSPSPTEIAALLSERSAKAAAVKARREFEYAPPQTAFRNIYAVVVPGAFNGVAPGEAYVGFCGQIKTPPGPASFWGFSSTIWTPFFVSATPSSVDGYARRIFIGNARVAERCDGERSATAYTTYFLGVSQRNAAASPDSLPRAFPNRLTLATYDVP